MPSEHTTDTTQTEINQTQPKPDWTNFHDFFVKILQEKSDHFYMEILMDLDEKKDPIKA